MRTRMLAACLSLAFTACHSTETQEISTAQERADDIGSTADLRAALAALPSAEVLGAHDNGVPYMIRGRLGSAGASVKGLSAPEAHARVGAALAQIAPAFRMNASDLIVRRVSVDEEGNTHLRYDQMRNGLQVVGQELILHLDPAGQVFAVNGTARDGESAPAKARISPEAATAAALDSTSGRHLASEGEARLVYLRAGEEERLKLVYAVKVTGEGLDLPIQEHVYVNALTGAIEGRNTEIHTAQSRAVYSSNNGTTLPGTLKRSEGGAVTGDTHVDENYDHLGTTYRCYYENFGRDSYNGAGAQLRSSVHYSTNYTNAYWNGTQMVYGDSNGVDSAPLGKSQDVTVHELTHAVTSSESNLIYSGESGALNEALSDIFGAYCECWKKNWVWDRPVWLVGDDVWTPATAGDALRYMDNPTQDGSSKDYYPTRYTGTSDNGGVHWNSGIVNLVFKLLVTGGKHPRGMTDIEVPAIGCRKAGAIFYKANTDLFTASTTLAQAKTYTEQAAAMLFGTGSIEQNAVNLAWQAVGVGLPPPLPTALTNGVALTNQSASAGSEKHYYLDVPAGRASSFVSSGGTGDADLYVRIGATPTTSSYNCRPYLGGNAETCNIAAQTANQRMYVMLRAYSTFSGVSIKGTY
ncbi:Zn-dependent metalloprotease [Archangium gephyra]|uniref:Neutral metalloproteinase n=1 Tax=Archangium gephyra TaxID=48 RepID=A0AAC8TAX9_9BACT|nr:M4 family metallopeptidase [Archangium gephyra]AKI99052.1 Zinc metalloproteinase precursor/aureolysin [Archangium gephyra]REG30960.1 Zn-dependent metalloprotease [Archangium gephyra]